MDLAYRLYELAVDDPVSLGPYRLLGRIYHDSRITTYLGEDVTGRRVAITCAGRGGAGRLRAEMERLWRAPSSVVPRLLDAALEHDPPYLVRELVDGPSLAQFVQWRGTLAGADLRGFAEELAAALHSLHNAGAAHGALTPGKLLVGPAGIRLIGFDTERNGYGPAPGEHAFCAPEALDAASGSWPGPPEDVFGWACLVVYAATARSPYAAETRADVVRKILEGSPDVDGVPAPIRPIILSALARDPAQRPGMPEVLTALLAEAPDPHARRPRHAITQAPEPVARPARSRTGRHRWIAAAAVLAVVAVGGAVLLQQRTSDSKQTAAPASAPPSAGSAAGGSIPEPFESAPPVTAALPTTGQPTGGEVIVFDTLAKPVHWANSRLPDGSGECLVRGGLQMTLTKPGSLQCLGPAETMVDDLSIEALATLHTPGSCAVVWFHADAKTGRGTALRLCEQQIVVAPEPPGGAPPYAILPLNQATALQKPVRLHLVVKDRKVAVWRDGEFAGTVELSAGERDTGQILLGLSTDLTAAPGPHRATFNEIDIRSLGPV